MQQKYYEPIDEVTYGRAILLLPNRDKVDIPVCNIVLPVRQRNTTKEKNVFIKFVWHIKEKSWRLLNPLLVKPKNRVAKITCKECGHNRFTVNLKVTKAKCQKCGTIGKIKY